MMKLNYGDLTITELLELAEGDLDQAQLATRLVRRLTIEVKKRVHGGKLDASEANHLDALTQVTEQALEVGAV